MLRQGKDALKLKAVMQRLANKDVLDRKYGDHKLIGKHTGHRECHIEPDWLLIYKVNQNEEAIIFVRTGSHAELFE